MDFQLAPTAAGEGYRLATFASVGSTNAVALERALEGDAGRLWLVSSDQRNGRGRRGRTWEASAGNLAATLLLTDLDDLSASATLGFVAGLAICDALDAVAPDAGVRFDLKWPNDVLANGAKLSGILLESVQLPGGRFGLVIGIGVNVVSYPDDTPYPATSLAALGARCPAPELFLALSDAWIDTMRLWDGGRGLAAIRNRWLARAAGRGSEISVRLHNGVLRGIFETIDDECRLVLKNEQGELQMIAAGDVFFGAPALADSL